MSGAELFGIASGAAGVVSLSIQLLDSAQKLKGFYDDYINAPQRLKNAVEALETLADTLEFLEDIRPRNDADFDILEKPVLHCCNVLFQILRKLQGMREKGMTKWKGKFSAAFKKPETEEALRRLEEAKSSLQISLNTYDLKIHQERIKRDENIRHLDDDRRRRKEEQRRLEREERQRRDQEERLVEDEHQRQVTEYLKDFQETVIPLAHQIGTFVPLNNQMLLAVSQMRTQIQQQTEMIQRLTTQPPFHEPVQSSSKVQESGCKGKKGNTSLQDTASTRNYSTSIRRYKKAQRPNHRFRISLPWLSSRVWDFALLQAEGGWNVCMRTYNMRPSNSPIFRLCAQGDIEGIQELVRKGEASLLDCDSDGRSLLSRSIYAGRTDLSKFLLDNTAWPDKQDAMRDALQSVHFAYYFITTFESRLLEIYYELLSEKHELDLETISLSNLIDNFTCAACSILIRNQAALSLYPVTPQYYCGYLSEIMIQARPGELLSVFDADVFDPHIEDANGRTALHLVASQLVLGICYLRYPPEILKEWSDVGTSLIQRGAKLIHPNMKQTPLSRGIMWIDLLGADPYHVLQLVISWAQMVHGAGVDLSSYGHAESLAWNGPRPIVDFLVYLQYGQTPEDWGLRFQRIVTIEFYQLIIPAPCGFSVSQLLPNSIIWFPSKQESENEIFWKHHPEKDFVLLSAPVLVSSPYELLPKITTMETLFQASQDDASIIPLMVRRWARRKSTPRRSHSQPPSLKPRESEHHIPDIWNDERVATWIQQFHLCPFDWKYCIGCRRPDRLVNLRNKFPYRLIDLRSCVKGDRHEDETAVLMWNFNREWLEKCGLSTRSCSARSERWKEI